MLEGLGGGSASSLPTSWLSAEEWAVLYAQVRPPKHTLDDFKARALTNRLSVYKVAELEKLRKQVRLFLQSKGRLMDADMARSMKKEDLTLFLQQALTSESLQPSSSGHPGEPHSNEEEDPSPRAARALRRRLHRTEDGTWAHGDLTPDAEPDEPTMAPRPPAGTQTKQTVGAPPAPPAAGTNYTTTMVHSALPTAPVARSNFKSGNKLIPKSTLLSELPPDVTGGRGPAESPRAKLIPASAWDLSSGRAAREGPAASGYSSVFRGKPLPPVAPQPAPSALAKVELFKWQGEAPAKPPSRSQFERYESPLLQIVHSIQRIPLRVGSFNKTVMLPTEYLLAVAERKMRVVLFPVDGVGFAPAPWPPVRDLVVSVNRDQIRSQWRRGWPLRQGELVKSYLTLDVTLQINSSTAAQNIFLDCFNREYYAMVVIAIARPITEAEAASRLRALASVERSYWHCQTVKALYTLYHDTIKEAELADEEADVQVDVTASTVSLKCPITQLRTRIPARGASCRHLQCFDLSGALRNCHIASYWCCPLCDKPMPASELVIDPHLERVLRTMPTTVKSVRLVPTPADPFNWVPALSEEDDDNTTSNASPTNRLVGSGGPSTIRAGSLESLLTASSDNDRARPSNGRRGAGSAVDPISID
jgi:hypothetical protein